MNSDAFAKGQAIRRKVLGDAYVDSVSAPRDAFSQELQKYVAENCWGGIWSRPGLSLKTRSFLNLAMLSALVRPHELKIHLRGALNNGITREEIAEVFLQTAMYCGTPAAVEAFRCAREVFADIDATQSSPQRGSS
ncbi:carboxymuconolactone decarboxylase family protein [Hydrogenophaga sp.]|uniref:carboxymuconolactone decarboxylase family protein n=1 Tax=Hydrogenophaga sp. TaxID=1904254 RepID=UPI00262394A8|nr:carboxymuconolactone decarboxylase family protein [Hydrogenophaga sp.]MCW5655410.1 carboxymuconolactone decarboxylase family protein [Hydrogenophaga sp.]